MSYGKKIKRSLPLFLPFLALTACAEHREEFNDPVPGYYQKAVDGSVNNILEQQSQIATSSLQTLAMIKRTRTPPTIDPTPDSQVPPEFRTHVTEVNWVGTADGIVQDLAEKAGYTYIPPRISQSQPAMVNLTLRDESIAKALDAIGLQIQEKEKIVVDPENKTVTLTPVGEPIPDSPMPTRSNVKHVKHISHKVKATGKYVKGRS